MTDDRHRGSKQSPTKSQWMYSYLHLIFLTANVKFVVFVLALIKFNPTMGGYVSAVYDAFIRFT